ncbi:serine protease [Patescibacteria group bacterium AH-259-L07]|nr:serine protease [Patescibacteria group bacterium AH-259-L07]
MEKYVIDPKLLHEAQQNAVITLSTVVSKNNTIEGAGIIIAENKILAPLHCTTGKTIVIKDKKIYPVRNEGSFLSEAEIAVLTINKPAFHKPNLKIAPDVEQGEFVFWTAPFDKLKKPVFSGYISTSAIGDDNMMYYYVDGTVVPGMSGAGIYNHTGELIGVLKGIQTYNEAKIGIILPVTYLLPFIYSCREDLHPPKAEA